MPGLERRLKAQLLGDVEFDAFTRGRYATDASHYQITPLGVAAPRTLKEIEYTLAIAREEGVSDNEVRNRTWSATCANFGFAAWRLHQASRIEPACRFCRGLCVRSGGR